MDNGSAYIFCLNEHEHQAECSKTRTFCGGFASTDRSYFVSKMNFSIIVNNKNSSRESPEKPTTKLSELFARRQLLNQKPLSADNISHMALFELDKPFEKKPQTLKRQRTISPLASPKDETRHHNYQNQQQDLRSRINEIHSRQTSPRSTEQEINEYKDASDTTNNVPKRDKALGGENVENGKNIPIGTVAKNSIDKSDGPSNEGIADNSSSKWQELIEKFKNNKYGLLKQRWGTSTIANPKENLTLLQFSLSTLDYNITPPVRFDFTEAEKSERDLDESVEEAELRAKRPRRESCTIVIDKIVEDLDEKVEVLKAIMEGKKYNSLLGVKKKESMKMKRRTRKYLEKIEQQQNLKALSSSRLKKQLRGITSQIKSLLNVRGDVLDFHRFYDHFNLDEANVSCLDEQQAEDILETESVIASYRSAYSMA